MNFIANVFAGIWLGIASLFGFNKTEAPVVVTPVETVQVAPTEEVAEAPIEVPVPTKVAPKVTPKVVEKTVYVPIYVPAPATNTVVPTVAPVATQTHAKAPVKDTAAEQKAYNLKEWDRQITENKTRIAAINAEIAALIADNQTRYATYTALGTTSTSGDLEVYKQHVADNEAKRIQLMAESAELQTKINELVGYIKEAQ